MLAITSIFLFFCWWFLVLFFVVALNEWSYIEMRNTICFRQWNVVQKTVLTFRWSFRFLQVDSRFLFFVGCECGFFVFMFEKAAVAGRNCLLMRKSGLPLCFLYDAGVLTNARRRTTSKGIPLFLRFLWAFVLQSIAPAAVPYSMTHFQLMQLPSPLRNWDYCCLAIAMVAVSISTRAHTIKITHAQVLVIKFRFLAQFSSRKSIHRFYLFGMALSSFV